MRLPAPGLRGPLVHRISSHWCEEFTTKMRYFPNSFQHVFQTKLKYDFDDLNIIIINEKKKKTKKLISLEIAQSLADF